MSNLLRQNNPFVGDYAIIALYTIVLEVFVVYFEFNLERLAKSIAQNWSISCIRRRRGAGQPRSSRGFLRHARLGHEHRGAFLLFVFISALTLAFLLRSSKS